MNPRRLILSALALCLAVACKPSQSGGAGGGGQGGDALQCFDPISGPPSEACDGYAEGQVCSYGKLPSYDCTCKLEGNAKTWDCIPTGPGQGGAGGGGACHGDAEKWDAVEAAPLDCSTDADCCVVMNACLGEAQIVTAATYPAAQTAWPYCDASCTYDLLPAVDVACVEGACAFQIVEQDPQGTLRKSHCGL